MAAEHDAVNLMRVRTAFGLFATASPAVPFACDAWHAAAESDRAYALLVHHASLTGNNQLCLSDGCRDNDCGHADRCV